MDQHIVLSLNTIANIFKNYSISSYSYQEEASITRQDIEVFNVSIKKVEDIKNQINQLRITYIEIVSIICHFEDEHWSLESNTFFSLHIIN